jgi:hypothetical protein
VFKKARVSLVLVVVSAILTTALPATAEPVSTGNTECATSTSATVAESLEGSALGKARATALASADVKALRGHLVEQGFRPQVNEAFGWIDEEANLVLILPFVPTDESSELGAGIMYREVDGEPLGAEAGVFSFSNDEEPSVDVMAQYAYENGQIVEAHSWWSCFWRCILVSCGIYCLGCVTYGPAWWACVSVRAGFSATLCSISCIGQ